MLRTYKPRQRGQAAAELALLLPFLAILLAGVIDVGRGFYARIELTNAVREGARYGASHPTDQSEIRQAAMDELANTSLRNLATNDITISTPNGTGARAPITVSAATEFRTFMGAVLGINSIPIRSSATMMILPGT